MLIALLEEYLELGGVGSLHLHFSLSARKKLPQYYDRTKAWDHNICQSFMLKVHGGIYYPENFGFGSVCLNLGTV